WPSRENCLSPSGQRPRTRPTYPRKCSSFVAAIVLLPLAGGMASGLLRRRMKGLGDHQIFIAAYVGLARTSQVEHQFDVHVGLRLGKVAGHQSPDIFRQRYTQFTGSLASAPMSVA